MYNGGSTEVLSYLVTVRNVAIITAIRRIRSTIPPLLIITIMTIRVMVITIV